MKNFLIPIAVVKILNFIEIKDGIAFKTNKVSKNALVQNSEGKTFIINFKNNFNKNISDEYVEWFLQDKASRIIKTDFLLKIQKSLEESDEIIDEIEKHCDENNLNRKESREYEKIFLEEKSKKMALNNKLIKKGSIVRLPLSYNGNKKVIFNDTEIELIDSLSLISIKEENGKEKSSNTGLFYIAQTRHELPIKLIKYKKDKNKFNITTNKNLMSYDNFITLINHSERTVKEKKGFYLFFLISDKLKEDKVFENIIDELNSPNRTNETYINFLYELKIYIENNKNYIKDITVFFPFKVSKEEIINNTDVLVTKLPGALTNISLSTQYNTAEEKNKLEENIRQEIKEGILDNKYSLDGIYSILSLTEEIESNTYGFLKNNIKNSSVMLNLSDTLEVLNKFKKQRLIDIEENKNTEVKTLNNGELDF